MCYYCGCNPSYYWPYVYYGAAYAYPLYGYTYAYYGLPSGYVYTLPSPPVFYTPVVQYPRGEHRVGNCLMIC